VDVLRDWIVGGLHLGHFAAGDRLASVRALSERLQADHRAIANAYRVLKAEGLVEMHARRGAYLRSAERSGDETLEEKARWLAGVLVESRRRRIPVRRLPEFIGGWTARTPLRCACIESNEDALTSLCTELSEDFGIDTSPIDAGALGDARDGAGQDAPLPPSIREAHALVTTAFHEPSVRRIGRISGKPTLVVTTKLEVVSVIEQHLESDDLVLLCADEAYGERFRSTLRSASQNAARLRVVPAQDSEAVASIDRSRPVVATHAALERVGRSGWNLLVPPYPTISDASAGEISHLLIRHNMSAAPR
jgi:DNA-binding transcriptional regulator YhcF (GntR family)